MDDSFGESFDKVGKMLGLPYPAGAIIENYAKRGDANVFDFTIPLQGTSSSMLAFSYSGLKNQVRLCIESHENLDEQTLCDICASFQRVAVTHLMQKIQKKPIKSVKSNTLVLWVEQVQAFARWA